MAIYSGFSHKKMVIFHSYVSLPEGKNKSSGTVVHHGLSCSIIFPRKTTVLGVHTPFPGNLLGFGFHSSPGFCKFLNQATQWSDKFIMIVE